MHTRKFDNQRSVSVNPCTLMVLETLIIDSNIYYETCVCDGRRIRPQFLAEDYLQSNPLKVSAVARSGKLNGVI
jgi:hypothetical protein